MPTREFLTKIALPLVMAIAPSSALQAGVEGGNAGDGVRCAASAALPMTGLYALDYVLTQRAAEGDDSDLVPIPSLDASLQRIGAQLRDKVPEMYESYREFVANLRNTTDYSRPRIWEPAAFGLDLITDNLVAGALPENCKEGGKAQLQRVVYRLWPEYSGRPFNSVTYQFVPTLWDELERTNPLQLSFMVVHEWLWDFGRNVQVNRRVNRLLHGAALERLSRGELLAQLRGIGLYLPAQVPEAFRDDACLPEEDVSNYWAQKLQLSPGRLILGKATLFVRQRQCSRRESCTEWSVQSLSPELWSGGALYLDMTVEGEFRINAMNDQHVVSTCAFDDKGEVSCRPWRSQSGQILSFGERYLDATTNNIVTSGVITRACAKLSARRRYPMDSIPPSGLSETVDVEEEWLVFTQLRP